MVPRCFFTDSVPQLHETVGGAQAAYRVQQYSEDQGGDGHRRLDHDVDDPGRGESERDVDEGQDVHGALEREAATAAPSRQRYDPQKLGLIHHGSRHVLVQQRGSLPLQVPQLLTWTVSRGLVFFSESGST